MKKKCVSPGSNHIERKLKKKHENQLPINQMFKDEVGKKKLIL